MNIRVATTEDAEAIKGVASISWRKTYQDIYPPNYIEQFIDKAYDVERLKQSITLCGQREDCCFAIALDDSNYCVGFAQAVPYKDGLELSRIYLLPEAQGRGIGHRLVEKIISVAISAGKQSLYVYVEKENKQASAFYQKHGFTIINEVEEEMQGVKSILLKCQKQLV